MIGKYKYVQINAAKKRGDEIETSKKFTAGQNKQHKTDKNTAILDAETEELHHERFVNLTWHDLNIIPFKGYSLIGSGNPTGSSSEGMDSERFGNKNK